MNDKGMSIIVKTISRFVASFIFLYGCYIILFGHLTPGGGFAGGVIIAGAFILIMLSSGKEEVIRFLPHKRVTFLESLGALIFLSFSVIPLFFGGKFFENVIHKKIGSIYFKFLSSGNILVYNIAIAIKVFAGIFFVFFVLSITRVVLYDNKLRFIKKK